MKTAVSIPDRVYQSAEKLAARLGVSRSELYSRALASLLEQHRDDVVTAQLNEVYGEAGEVSALERDVAILQSKSLAQEKW
jgi:metal-responsive CopG/Arc/MetJ family transcriptional regulator